MMGSLRMRVRSRLQSEHSGLQLLGLLAILTLLPLVFSASIHVELAPPL